MRPLPPDDDNSHHPEQMISPRSRKTNEGTGERRRGGIVADTRGTWMVMKMMALRGFDIASRDGGEKGWRERVCE